MNVLKLVDEANTTYNLNLSADGKRKIVSSLKIAGYEGEVLQRNIANVIEIIKRRAEAIGRYNPLKSAITAAQDTDRCPICGKVMGEVVMAGNKKAKYCPDHKLTLPTKNVEE